MVGLRGSVVADSYDEEGYYNSKCRIHMPEQILIMKNHLTEDHLANDQKEATA